MDIYFLLRWFHTYDLNKMNYGREGCKNPKYVNAVNSIVYGGSSHIHFYCTFFKNYFNINPEIEIIQNYNNKCIIFEKPFDFFG